MIGRPQLSLLKAHQRPRPRPTQTYQILRAHALNTRPENRVNLPPPFRHPAAHSQRRGFSSSSTRHEGGNFVNHYEILKVLPTASKSELKKQFYALSKETHPDRHPDDPTAGDRFSQISESYSILADETKRRNYDRDFHRGHGASRDTAASGSYAGSRPASGLSKRRGTFRGPPPSFYAQGAYGTTHNGTSSSSTSQSYQAGTFNSQSFQDRANTEYDPRGTYKTQSNEDVKRLQRRAAQFRAMQAEVDALSDTDFWGRFVIVTFVVALGVTVGSIIVNMSGTSRGGLTRGDGSKRNGQTNDWAKG